MEASDDDQVADQSDPMFECSVGKELVSITNV